MECEDFIRERHFVLDLMKFVFAIMGKPSQFCTQKMHDEYSKERESYFSKNIIQAIMVYLIEYRSSDLQLLDLASQAYQDKINELSMSNDYYEFLKFLAHYSWQSSTEYYYRKLLDSPSKFFSSIVQLLEERRKSEQCDGNFWESLEATAAKVVAKDLEIFKSDKRKIQIKNASLGICTEPRFVLEVMSIISLAYRNPLPYYLKRDLEEYRETSTLVLDPTLEKALHKAMANLEYNIAFLGGNDVAICEYFDSIVSTSFNARDFLEYCVCSSRKALIDFYIGSTGSCPREVYFRLVEILEIAKKEGKFKSVEDIIEGAYEILDKENDRKESMLVSSTELFSSVSTESNEPNSDMENSITPCDRSCKETVQRIFSGESSQAQEREAFSNARSQPASDHVTSKENVQLSSDKVASEANVQLSSDNVASELNVQLSSDNVASEESVQRSSLNVTSEESVQLPPDNVASEESVQLFSDNDTSEENVQPPTASLVSSEENAKVAPKYLICLCEPPAENEVHFCKNIESRSDFVNISSESATTRETALTRSGSASSTRNSEQNSSHDNTQATETTPMIRSGEHESSCRCNICKDCCITT